MDISFLAPTPQWLEPYRGFRGSHLILQICAGMLLDKMDVTNLQIRKTTAGREQLHRDDGAESHALSVSWRSSSRLKHTADFITVDQRSRSQRRSNTQTLTKPSRRCDYGGPFHVVQFLWFQYLIVKSRKLKKLWRATSPEKVWGGVEAEKAQLSQKTGGKKTSEALSLSRHVLCC